MNEVYGFTLVSERAIPEINSTARLFKHKKTGAELLSIENQDENKCFGINFATPPTDSTGLPHILEHCVLAGSKKYPVKEPFMELVKSSLASFINAMTFPDKTIYPVASQNAKDLYNLIDVYMDAVLHPRLAPEVLQQEGWHYELENKDDPLVYRGVVFNEMKGNYSSPDWLLYRYTRQSVFPDNAYGVDYGGDPVSIPDLTYEDFRAFHETYYHPSNARIFFYGDDNPEERLRLMNAYLQQFERKEIDTTIRPQTRFDQPRRRVIPYDAGEDADKKGIATVTWMLDTPQDIEQLFMLQVLDHVLLGTPASPLRKALIDSGLGEDVAGGGLQDDMRQYIFGTGLRGIKPHDADKVEEIILQTLESLAKDGIDPETVEASLNTLEFRLREYNTGNFPRGLAMLFESLRTWGYGGDPFEALAFEAPLNAVKARVAAGEKVFETLINTHLLNNTHRVTLILQPDSQTNQRLADEEKARLEAVRSRLSDDELQVIIEDTRKLKQMQETPDSPEALATIPVLTLADLDKKNKTTPLNIGQMKGSKLLHHDIFTNGIFYLDLGFNLYALPQDLLPMVTPFGKALLQMGTDKEDFVRLSQRIGRKTGGIQPAVFTSEMNAASGSAAWLFLRGKSTIDQIDDLLEILHDILLTARFDDKDRFLQIILNEKAGLESQLVNMGHQVIFKRMKARLTESGWAAEQIGGINYLFFLRDLVKAIETDWDSVQEKLETMRRHLIAREAVLYNVTLDGDNWQKAQSKLSAFGERLPDTPVQMARWNPAITRQHEGLTIPAQVNYVGRILPLDAAGYSYHGSASVIAKAISRSWLHENVRAQGGAYGVGAVIDQHANSLSFWSYRDPNLQATLNAYRKTADHLKTLDLPDSELTKSIIGGIADMDFYQLPDAKGYSAMQRHLIGYTDDKRQQVRDELLSTTAHHFQAFGDALAAAYDEGLTVVLGSLQAIEDANSAGGDLLNITKVQ